MAGHEIIPPPNDRQRMILAYLLEWPGATVAELAEQLEVNKTIARADAMALVRRGFADIDRSTTPYTFARTDFWIDADERGERQPKMVELTDHEVHGVLHMLRACVRDGIGGDPTRELIAAINAKRETVYALRHPDGNCDGCEVCL